LITGGAHRPAPVLHACRRRWRQPAAMSTRVAKVFKPFQLKVFFSNRYSYASILHKRAPSDPGHFVASASTLERPVREALRVAGQPLADRDAARLVGTRLAARAQELQLPSVHFARAQKQRYQGKLKALIEALREGGLRVE
jgi:ribosomal protein L18